MNDRGGPTISVVVPTYRRAERLRACLGGIDAQRRTVDELVVVRRRDDEPTRAVLAERGCRSREVIVDEPGVVSAIAAGLAASTGDIIALTDDDAVPRPDWIARILEHFADPALGVLGGRDVLVDHPPAGRNAARDVGRITAWGRLVGNHHAGGGHSRDVDVVKGVNLAIRRPAVALPVGLRGRGAQPHWEVALCRWAQSRGWRVAYDPQLLVDHHPAQRPAGDRRVARAPADVAAEAYNLVTAVLAQHPELIRRRAAFGLAIGDAAVPGLGRAAYAFLHRDVELVRRLPSSLAGQAAALRDVHRGDGLSAVPLQRSPEPLRVTLIAHDIHDGGGMERAQAELVRRVGPRVAFTVVSARLAPELRHRVVRWKRVPVPRRPFPLRFLAFYVLAGLRLRRLDGQLVHTCGAIVANRVDVATVHQCHAGLVAATGRCAPAGISIARRLNTGMTRGLSILAERWTYRHPRARMLAVVSPDLRREVRTHFAAVPAVVTPNGVDAGHLTPDPVIRARTRRERDVSDDDLVALFVGGNWAHKGLRTSIEALARAAETGVSVRLWVVGSGDVRGYRAYARQVGVEDRVTFFGSRTDVGNFYRGADVLVLPSLYEACSLVAREAAAAGCPVIITPVNGAVDLVGRDDAGILVERTPDSVAAALVRLAADPALRTRLGEEGRRRAIEQTWDASVDAVVDVYRELVGHRLMPTGVSHAR